MEKWNIAHLIQFKCEEGNHYKQSDVLTLLAAKILLWCCTIRQGHVKTKGGAQPGLYFCTVLRDSCASKTKISQKHHITACINFYFPILCFWSIYGNIVVYSWEPSFGNNQLQVWKNIFFEELSVRQICEILLVNREQSKVFTAILFVFLCSTCFFVLFNCA